MFSVLAITLAAFRLSASIVARKVVSGMELPDFSLDTVYGARVSRESLRGRRYVLLFSRGECAHCRQALPLIDRFLREVPESELPRWVVADGSVESAAMFRRRLKLGLPFATTRTPWSQFGVNRVPALVLADEKGRIHGAWSGGTRTTDVARRLAAPTWSSAEPLRLDPPLPRCSVCDK